MTFCIIPWCLYLGVFRNVMGDASGYDDRIIDWKLVFVLQRVWPTNHYRAFGFTHKS